MARPTQVAAPLWLAAALVSAATGHDASARSVHFVDASLTSGADDGTSWSDAFRSASGVTAALGAAAAGDEIWVAAGTYVPGPPRALTATFALVDGVALYGGFGGDESTLAERDPARHLTALSGDLAGDDGRTGVLGDNAFHVVTAIRTGADTVLDGFGIVGGEAPCCGALDTGGGLRIVGGAPTIRGCTFGSNSAASGADVSITDAAPLIDACTFTGTSQANRGSGIYHTGASAATVRACQFVGAPPTTGSSQGVGIYSNSAAAGTLTVQSCYFSIHPSVFPCPEGVGIHVTSGSHIEVRGCTFFENFTCASGGGIHCDGTGIVDRCVFVGNEARFDGGAALFSFQGELLVTNCLFNGNDRLGMVSTIMAQGVMHFVNCTFVSNGNTDAFELLAVSFAEGTSFENCIIHDQRSMLPPGDAIVFTPRWDPQPTFTRCLVEHWDGSLQGTDNFDAPPAFADPDGPDGIPATLDDNFHPGPGSPAIDAGYNGLVPANVTLDLAGGRRFVDAVDYADSGRGVGPIVDLGAYEASADTPLSCPTDLNGDGATGTGDLLVLFGGWGQSSGDVTGDGTTGVADLLVVLGAWGVCS
jgi:hypothetical protein